ncbi:DUF4124 domain-containing protein [Pelomonas sp. P7]|uniref:DUF4124 domain-containing protein n=2 Tax=Roseateles TaxID=93681 RepID=A0ABS8X7G1_9BURK|nr:DUF4124 domain-containing protein [Pelomonas sp. P7]MCE4536501.1 DUF4124 domain-containing protein [Pelomonas sp. P7]
MDRILGKDASSAMKRRAVGLGLCLAVAGAVAQPVWKCEAAGKVVFSDKPCPQSGRPVPLATLQPNVADSLKPDVVRAALGAAPASAAAPPAAGDAGNACPGDGELRGMETRANSTTLGDAERQFMQDEVRRARQCRAGEGHYTEGDWAISRDAQAAQTQLSDRARRDARLRAEAMHSAADPLEGDRIARRQLAEERMRRAEQRRAQNAASQPMN